MLCTGLIDRRFSGAVCHNGYFCSCGRMQNWFRYILLGSLKFLLETLHVAIEDASIFGVFGIFIMTCATCEVRTQWMFIARQCAVRDAVAIFIKITSPITFKLFKVFFT